LKKILIRADGSKDIGMGHLSRCCLIANYLFAEKNIQSIIIIRNDIAAKNFISNKCKAAIIHYIDNNLPHKAELACISAIVSKESILLILLDLLETNLTDQYISGLYENNIPVSAIIDDSERRIIDVDLILNGNPNQDRFDYGEERGEYLLGASYFIMDPSYADNSIISKTPGSRILLTLGGSDHNNLIFAVLDVLVNISSVSEVVILTSKSTGYSDELSKFVNDQSKKIRLYIDVPTLQPYWSECDLAITAGGNTLFERIASGVPGASICQLPRQMEIADKFEVMGVNRNIGYGPEIESDILMKSINDFITDDSSHLKQQQKCREIITGSGIKLFSNELIKLVGDSNEL